MLDGRKPTHWFHNQGLEAENTVPQELAEEVYEGCRPNNEGWTERSWGNAARDPREVKNTDKKNEKGQAKNAAPHGKKCCGGGAVPN